MYANENEKKRLKKIEELAGRGCLFHNVITPRQVVVDMLEQIEYEFDDLSFLVMFNPEIAVILQETYGASDVTLYTVGQAEKMIAERMGIPVIEEVSDSMRFDVVVGNPPFSNPKEGKTAGKYCEQLYPKFFKMALQIADIVAMIMPTTNKKVSKKHNTLLKDNANVIEFIDDGVMDVTMPMWYVICDDSDRNPAVEFTVTQNGNTIPWEKGKVHMTAFKHAYGNHGVEKPNASTKITIYHKLNGKELVLKYARENQVKLSQRFPDSGYAVIMPQTITDDGWTDVRVVKCDGMQAAFNGVNVVFCDTKKQANRLIEYMETDTFKNGANAVKQGFNNMTKACLQSVVIPKEDEDYIING